MERATTQGEGGNRIVGGLSYLRLTDLAARRYSQELRVPKVALALLPLVDPVEQILQIMRTPT
jgi:hypothetical protein